MHSQLLQIADERALAAEQKASQLEREVSRAGCGDREEEMRERGKEKLEGGRKRGRIKEMGKPSAEREREREGGREGGRETDRQRELLECSLNLGKEKEGM